MRYILLEISRRTIALFTNKGDGTRTFQPFGEGQALPLALCYLNGEYHTGVFALQQKENGDPNAFSDLFAEARKSNVCHEIKGRDFVTQVIKLTVAQICREHFLIDVAHQASEITLVLLFGIDVSDTERDMLIDSLRPEKYAKVIAADKGQRATLTTLQQNSADLNKDKASLIISSDNTDLSIKCISTTDGHTFVEKTLLGKGKDPRFQFGIDKLWAGVESQSYSNKEKELPYLQSALRGFIASNKVEITSITLSDGEDYSTFLSRSMYDNFTSNDCTVSTDFASILKAGKISPCDCFVILENFAAGNKFFRDALTQFSPIYDEDKPLKKEIRDQLMRDLLDERSVSFYNVKAIKEEERKRQLEEERERQEKLRAEQEREEFEKLKTKTPTAYTEEEKEETPSILSYDGSRKFSLKATVCKTGFFSKKISFSIDVEIEDNKPLPCNCALTIDSQNYKSYREETKFEELDQNEKGPFRFGPYQMPLPGIDKGTKTLYIHIYPTEKSFPVNLFKKNHLTIEL